MPSHLPPEFPNSAVDSEVAGKKEGTREKGRGALIQGKEGERRKKDSLASFFSLLVRSPLLYPEGRKVKNWGGKKRGGKKKRMWGLSVKYHGQFAWAKLILYRKTKKRKGGCQGGGEKERKRRTPPGRTFYCGHYRLSILARTVFLIKRKKGEEKGVPWR